MSDLLKSFAIFHMNESGDRKTIVKVKKTEIISVYGYKHTDTYTHIQIPVCLSVYTYIKCVYAYM